MGTLKLSIVPIVISVNTFRLTFGIIFFMSFRENVKSELQFLDMQIKRLSELSGVKRQTLASYLGEREKTPSVDAAVKIARVLGVSVEYLVTGQDTKNKREPAPTTPEARFVAQIMEELDNADRKIVLNMVSLLKEREKIVKN
jgi:transcriptional regulator with XRE-family HTH domain